MQSSTNRKNAASFLSLLQDSFRIGVDTLKPVGLQKRLKETPAFEGNLNFTVAHSLSVETLNGYGIKWFTREKGVHIEISLVKAYF